MKTFLSTHSWGEKEITAKHLKKVMSKKPIKYTSFTITRIGYRWAAMNASGILEGVTYRTKRELVRLVEEVFCGQCMNDGIIIPTKHL